MRQINLWVLPLNCSLYKCKSSTNMSDKFDLSVWTVTSLLTLTQLEIISMLDLLAPTWTYQLNDYVLTLCCFPKYSFFHFVH